MSVNYLGYLAAILYISSVIFTLLDKPNEQQKRLNRLVFKSMTCLAIVAHGASIYFVAFSQPLPNLSLFNTASIVTFIISIIIVLGSRIRTVSVTALVAFPLSSLFIVLSIIYPIDNSFSTNHLGVKTHVVLSLLAYSFFSVAVVQALFLSITEYRLKAHRPIMNLLPPLSRIEDLMFLSTVIAFCLLTVGIIIGTISVKNIFEQNFSHKVFFSILAWLTFLTLIVGKFRYQLRGKKATYLILGGFLLLALGFFGSKFVVEIILGRN
ncbi:MAG: cytochrome c biogenesis protein CcsA [Pseudomonadota bacterium]|nr:cytochrome c biogenesis protein CcsA [Pseudomonadota bacterium]